MLYLGGGMDRSIRLTQSVFRRSLSTLWYPMRARMQAAVRQASPSSLKLICICLGLAFAHTHNPAAAEDGAIREMRDRMEQSRDLAIGVARERGLPVSGRIGDLGGWELVGFEDGRPIIHETQATKASKSTQASVVWASPYSLQGAGWRVGVWDFGTVRNDHVELVGRVSVINPSPFASHPTFVAGIIAGAGVNADAKGAAPQLHIDSWNWSGDRQELLDNAATAPGQHASTFYLSNHSYGEPTGWAQGTYSGNSGRHFFGIWDEEDPPKKSDLFGQYTQSARDWDLVAWARPYLVIIKAAGNDRNVPAPSSGNTFYYFWSDDDDFEWRSTVYDPDIHPAGDGLTDGGYDTMPPWSTAKNVVAIGSVFAAIDSNGNRDLSLATPSPFSAWGPADDGRIKPEFVAVGQAVTSPNANQNNTYSTASGTSFSAPSAAGSIILLQQYNEQLNPGGAMLAASVKALLAHTADDLDQPPFNPGPDYASGWGLINVLNGVEFLQGTTEPEPSSHLFESELLDEEFTWSRIFAVDENTEELRATLSWTDPPGPLRFGLDNRDPVLVNDLELRLVSPSSSVYYPFVLDPENPSAIATTGPNNVDVIEQVRVAEPDEGKWTVLVFSNGELLGESQSFSLTVSGGTLFTPTEVDAWMLLDN